MQAFDQMVFDDDSVNKAAAYMREHRIIPERMHTKQVLAPT